MTKEKPVQGHKLGGYNYGVSVRCECGWTSVTSFGKGARGDALAQWRWHKERSVKASCKDAT